MDVYLLMYLLLFFVAFCYASVGHGGASGYLALLALFGAAGSVMKPTALLLNLFVSLVSFIGFYRGNFFKWKIFLPFALASVPMAFVGGLIEIDGRPYKTILGLLLLFPIFRLLLLAAVKEDKLQPHKVLPAIFIGAAIGFLSGLIGIGGGIILSPVLLLLRWTNLKQTAAISALFIFVNSLSGLAGQLTKGVQFTTNMFLYVAIAFVGGLCGAYFGSMRFNSNLLQRMLAVVLLLASYKLLFTNA